jgi:hypothetical protein
VKTLESIALLGNLDKEAGKGIEYITTVIEGSFSKVISSLVPSGNVFGPNPKSATLPPFHFHAPLVNFGWIG